MDVRPLLTLTAVVAGLGCAGCTKRAERATGSSAAAAADAAPVPTGPGAPTPLPPAAADGLLGPTGPLRFLGAADDGSWVTTCLDAETRPYLSVGAGPGVAVDRVLASSSRDVIATRAGALIHVDVVARTERTLGPLAPVAVDGASRRVVVARGDALVVFEPGAPPRTVATGGAVSAVWLRTPRWAVVEHGAVRTSDGVGCDTPSAFAGAPSATIDLDPGAEAVDRIGPALAITPAGEVTLDGEVVIGPECVPTVIAALASPPRVLARCGSRDLVAGPRGFREWVSVTIGMSTIEQATIAESLQLGRRVVCENGGCVDLVTGADFSTYQHSLVWHDDHTIVRKQPGGLWIDRLPLDPDGEVAHVELALPRIAAAVTVDTVTGRRQAGTAPALPEFVDAAGHWLLYGRFVIDLEAGAVVTTLATDALAIDDRGRVLVPAAASTGPLRWLATHRP